MAAECRVSRIGTTGHLFSILRRRKIITPILPQSGEMGMVSNENPKISEPDSNDILRTAKCTYSQSITVKGAMHLK